MRHTLTTQGYGIRLRPVQIEDAPFIVWLRNQGFVIGRVGDSAADQASQEKWLNGYFERENDYYFLAETLKGIPLGTCAMYNLNGTHCEIGRLIFRHGVSAATTSCFLLLDLFYEHMGVTQVHATSVTGNFGVHSLLRKYAFREETSQHSVQVIGGNTVEMLHFVQNAEDWPPIRAKVHKLELIEPRILKWEQEYLDHHAADELPAESQLNVL